MFLKSQRAASTDEAEGGASMIETDPPRHQHQRRTLYLDRYTTLLM